MLRTKSLLRKSPTSSVVEGPPIFINTIAVGPFEPVAFCVTGGATLALPLLHCDKTDVAGVVDVARLQALAMGARNAIEKKCDGGTTKGQFVAGTEEGCFQLYGIQYGSFGMESKATGNELPQRSGGGVGR